VVLGAEFNTPVQFLAAASRVLEEGRTGSIAGKHVAAYRNTDMAVEELLAPGWRYRSRPMPFNLSQMLRASLTVGAVEDQIGAAMYQTRAELQSQQPNGEWALVAWDLREVETHRSARTTKERNAADAAWSAHSGADKPSRTKEVLVVETGLVLDTAWIDLVKGPELDEHERRTGGKDGSMSSIAQGHLPAWLRAEYEGAKRIISGFFRDRGVEIVEEWSLSAEALDQVKVFRDRGVPWRNIATVMGMDAEALQAECEARALPPGVPVDETPAKPKRRRTNPPPAPEAAE